MHNSNDSVVMYAQRCLRVDVVNDPLGFGIGVQIVWRSLKA